VRRNDPYDSPDRELVAQLRAENELLRRNNERYRRMLERDPVTGLFSRCHFEWRLDYEWSRATCFWTPLSLLYVGVDGLMELRHRAGPRASLELVRAAARLLDAACRDVDIVCRIAPDGFAVILPGTNRLGAEAIAMRFEELWNGTAWPAPGVELAFGLGVAFGESRSPGELVRMASEALLRDRGGMRPSSAPTEPSLARPPWIDAA
jgi:diguanylate cyclase (GGDEF)-like protein